MTAPGSGAEDGRTRIAGIFFTNESHGHIVTELFSNTFSTDDWDARWTYKRRGVVTTFFAFGTEWYVHSKGRDLCLYENGQNSSVEISEDGGIQWSDRHFGDPRKVADSKFQCLFMLDDRTAWIGGTKGAILTTHDGSMWYRQTTGTPATIYALYFQDDRRNGWAAGERGTILRTNDGGEHWIPATEGLTSYHAAYSPLIAPWYLTSLAASLLLFSLILLPAAPPLMEQAVELIGISDAPLGKNDADVLSYGPTARGISYFIRNSRTQAPLTLAITGRWGVGKTSTMRLLMYDLQGYGFRPVWFNAWHHQKEEQMLPALLDTIRKDAVPKPWHPGGLTFRAKLLGARWYWGLVAAAFCFALGAAVAGVRNFIEFRTVALIGTLSSGASLVAAARKWTSAFGSKPALSARSISQPKTSDLRLLTSFRYSFAKEFSEVTTALGARKLVIFIDDLDRCAPQNMLDMLESVNFLVSSGDCFVIMGMDQEVVEECVADNMALTTEAFRRTHAAVSQRQVAQMYLDKLINMQVPVPSRDAGDFIAMVAGLKQQRNRTGWRKRWTKTARVTAAALVLVLAGVLGAMGYMLDPIRYIAGSKISAIAKPASDSQEALMSSRQATVRETKQKGETSTTVREEPKTFAAPVYGSLSRAYWLSGGVALLVFFLLLAWAGYRFATTRPNLIIEDTEDFDNALRLALPVVARAEPTPRAVKRFVNRVRFLAMRQRQWTEDDRSLWVRLANHAPKSPRHEDAPEFIPEEALVLLAAQFRVSPESFTDDVTLSEALGGWAIERAERTASYRKRFLNLVGEPSDGATVTPASTP